MKFSLNSMKAATDLTRSGKLLEATALIQKLLSKDTKPQRQGSQSAPWQQTKLPSNTVYRAASQPTVPTKASSEGKPTAKGGRFESKQYTCHLGLRSYMLFTPSNYNGEPMPLVVMLHGCTQNPEDFAAGTQMNALAEEIGFFVAYPAQPKSANSMGCWNWFNSADQKKDKGEPALIAGIAREIMVDHAIDAQRVYVAGLSAGGAMAAVLGMTYPDLFAAIGVHSGLPCGAAKDVASAFAVMNRGASHVGKSTNSVPTIVFHGDQDQTVHPANADDVLEQFDPTVGPVRYETTSEKSASGMKYSTSVHANNNGTAIYEKWLVHGAGHAWSGGSAQGSYTEPRGPDASREMIRFFFEHRLANK